MPVQSNVTKKRPTTPCSKCGTPIPNQGLKGHESACIGRKAAPKKQPRRPDGWKPTERPPILLHNGTAIADQLFALTQERENPEWIQKAGEFLMRRAGAIE